MARILLPEILQEQRRFGVPFGELYRQWAAIRDEREFWQLYNIRFEHNPEWRNNVWSMQAMHDGKGGWGDVKIATMMMMGGAPFIWTAAAVVAWEAMKAMRDNHATE